MPPFCWWRGAFPGDPDAAIENDPSKIDDDGRIDDWFRRLADVYGVDSWSYTGGSASSQKRVDFSAVPQFEEYAPGEGPNSPSGFQEGLVAAATRRGMYVRLNYPGAEMGFFKMANVCGMSGLLPRETCLHNGLVPTAGSDWLLTWSGGSLRDPSYQGIAETQKVNHFPGGSELTRKDRCWIHYKKMQELYGSEEYNFMPDTFVLPEETEQFLESWEKHQGLWIVKPTASSRGRGIFILQNLSDLPLEDAAVISRYVADPLLIQGLKFDLRLYVLVTCFDPLKVYIYKEGLARFASSPFSTTEEDLQDPFKHLTNYSINKHAQNYVENCGANADNYGHKWSLSALNKHLRCTGVDVKTVWADIIDVIMKSLFAVQPKIVNKMKDLGLCRTNCFELYGFDILLDSKLMPWLLEVNLSPSMVAESPLDRKVKGSLVADMFNVVGVTAQDRAALNASRVKTRLRQMGRTRPTGLDSGMSPYLQPAMNFMGRGPGAMDIMEMKTGEDIEMTDKHFRAVGSMVDEFARAKDANFVRLFPHYDTVKRYRGILEDHSESCPATSYAVNVLFDKNVKTDNVKRVDRYGRASMKPQIPKASDGPKGKSAMTSGVQSKNNIDESEDGGSPKAKTKSPKAKKRSSSTGKLQKQSAEIGIYF